MLRIYRSERIAFYEDKAYLLAKEQLENDVLSSSQKRLYFNYNYNILKPLSSDLLMVFSGKRIHCESLVSSPGISGG